MDNRQISSPAPEESSAEIRARVVAARRWQQERYYGRGFSSNSALSLGLLREPLFT